jgi:hypothetical protein
MNSTSVYLCTLFLGHRSIWHYSILFFLGLALQTISLVAFTLALERDYVRFTSRYNYSTA